MGTLVYCYVIRSDRYHPIVWIGEGMRVPSSPCVIGSGIQTGRLYSTCWLGLCLRHISKGTFKKATEDETVESEKLVRVDPPFVLSV